MSPAMWVSLAILVVGILMVAALPLLNDEPEGNAPFYPMVAGYFVALAGAAALFVAWMIHRSRHNEPPGR